MKELDLEVVGTGLYWVGGKIRSVDSAARDLILQSRRELQLVTYELRTDARHVLEIAQNRLEAGVTVTVVVNRLDNKPKSIRRYLDSLLNTYPGFHLYDFVPPDSDEDLHAKLMVADRRCALIGSANMSWRGLVKNHELGTLLTGDPVVAISSAIDKLLRSPYAEEVRVRGS